MVSDQSCSCPKCQTDVVLDQSYRRLELLPLLLKPLQDGIGRIGCIKQGYQP